MTPRQSGTLMVDATAGADASSAAASPCEVFITGGTGYLGRTLVARLLERGHRVRALVRPGSEGRLPPGTEAVRGNALEHHSFVEAIPPADTLIHLVGTPRPSPAKAAEFRRVDLASIQASATAAAAAGVRHLIYLSVAHPAPVMRAYIGVRQEGEALVRATGLPATLLRPWYVLGPGHRWPYLLTPMYALLRLLPSTREGAERLGLVSHRQMISALIKAVEQPPTGVRIVEVPEIRAGAGVPGG
jgi:uncharacterized protein YbjT (DUF2867 family)